MRMSESHQSRSLSQEEYTLTLLADAAHDCARDQHERCLGSTACIAVWHAQEAALERDTASRQYDISVVVRSVSGEPTAHWPTAALVKTVDSCLLQPPWESPDRFMRSILITSALARHGERGIPADAVIRTALAPRLRRQVILRL